MSQTSKPLTLGDVLDDTRVKLKYSVHPEKTYAEWLTKIRGPVGILSGEVSMTPRREAELLNEALNIVGEPLIELDEAKDLRYYEREVGPENTGALSSKFYGGMLRYTQGLKRKETHEQAFEEAKKAMGGR